MKIIARNILRGPNFWDKNYHQLIVATIDFESMPKAFPQKSGFKKKYAEIFKEHSGNKLPYNNIAKAIGFSAIHLQNIAGLHTSFFEVFPTGDGNTVTIAVEYKLEEAGKEALNAAISAIKSIVNNEHFEVKPIIEELNYLKERYSPGIGEMALFKEAELRGIPISKGFNRPEVVFGYGRHQKKVNASITNHTSFLGVEITDDKVLTKKVLGAAEVPVPKGFVITRKDDIYKVVDRIGFPVVVKPPDSNNGRGISLNLKTIREVEDAYEISKVYSQDVIIEKFIKGADYRLLVINNKFTAALKRIAANITGDGASSIEALIEEENKNPLRQPGGILTPIEVDEITLNILKKNNLKLGSILQKGERLFVKETANVSAGGVPEDVTEQVHPVNIQLAERIAKICMLDVCGIDLIAEDISIPYTESDVAVIEVNASPGIKMHMAPIKGKPVNVAGSIMDMLFPKGSKATIPTAAVTGTNGKTTIVRFMAYMAQVAGHTVGFTTTEGIYLGPCLQEGIDKNHLNQKQENSSIIIDRGDCSGPKSAAVVLKDPIIDYALLECARGGIIRSGLPFKYCDIAVVSNVSDDHLGLKGIDTIEDMAKVKSVVPASVSPTGYAILNADDKLVVKMANTVSGKVAFFSMDGNNTKLKKHLKKGGVGAFYQNGSIHLYNGEVLIYMEDVKNIPLTIGGKVGYMIQNTLPVLLFGYVAGFELIKIKEALLNFKPSPSQTPGRLNLYDFEDFLLLVDYAHNPAGYDAIGDFIKQFDVKWKTGVIAAQGDRKEETIRELGKKAASMFDEIIIRNNKSQRGRPYEEIHTLLKEGIDEVNPDIPVKVIANEQEASEYAILHAKRNSLVVIFTEQVEQTLKVVDGMLHELVPG
jgi:cyanophycin synthetase